MQFNLKPETLKYNSYDACEASLELASPEQIPLFEHLVVMRAACQESSQQMD